MEGQLWEQESVYWLQIVQSVHAFSAVPAGMLRLAVPVSTLQ